MTDNITMYFTEADNSKLCFCPMSKVIFNYTISLTQADAEELELSLLLKECLESTVRMNLYPKASFYYL